MNLAIHDATALNITWEQFKNPGGGELLTNTTKLRNS